MQARVYFIKWHIRYLKFVKGKLVFGVGWYNREIFQSIKKGYFTLYFIIAKLYSP